jgi:hypothetical protein
VGNDSNEQTLAAATLPAFAATLELVTAVFQLLAEITRIVSVPIQVPL